MSPTSRVASRRRFAALAVIVAIAAFFVVRNAGAWLVVDEPLQPSEAIVVLGGDVPFRAMEAAALYTQGVAPQVWLTRGEHTASDVALEQLRVARTTEFEVSRQVLLRLGVPDTSIRILPGETPNTADEVRLVSRELQAAGGTRVVLVTSKYHARRVRTVWWKLVGSAPAAVVRVARNDPSDPVHWWRRTADATFVWREWFGILNVLAGFPMPH